MYIFLDSKNLEESAPAAFDRVALTVFRGFSKISGEIYGKTTFGKTVRYVTVTKGNVFYTIGTIGYAKCIIVDDPL